MNETGAKNFEKVGLFQIVVLILSIVVLAALGADAAFQIVEGNFGHLLNARHICGGHRTHGHARLVTLYFIGEKKNFANDGCRAAMRQMRSKQTRLVQELS
jgi:hypothetical protein